MGAVASGLLAIGGWFVLYLIVFGDLGGRRRLVFRDFRKETFQARPERNVPISRRLQERLDAISWGQLGNVTVYSEFDPFVGTGQQVPGWSFAMPLVPDTDPLAGSSPDGTAQSFSVADLVDHVRRRIAEISSSSDGGGHQEPSSQEPLDGLLVSEQVFVSGLAIEKDKRFLATPASPPRTHLSEADIEQIACDPHGAVRHYLSAYVQSWEGEIVAFTFFHFSTDGEKLYCECVRRVLLPIRKEHHSVDTMRPEISGREFLRMAAEAAGQTVLAAAGSPFRLIGDLLFDLRDDRPPAGTVIDYGTRLAVRELGAEEVAHNYFQLLDTDKHWKILERQALWAVREFLDDHGIDTSEFRNRQTAILNNGIIQAGSGNTFGAQSVGSGAKATQNTGSEQSANNDAR
jgi:hypothetical protein